MSLKIYGIIYTFPIPMATFDSKLFLIEEKNSLFFYTQHAWMIKRSLHIDALIIPSVLLFRTSISISCHNHSRSREPVEQQCHMTDSQLECKCYGQTKNKQINKNRIN